MSEIRVIQKQFCSQAMAAAIVIALIFLAAGAKPIAKGLILGTLFSIINFIMMAQSLPMKFNKGQTKTFFICLGALLFRHALLALPLVIAAKMDDYNFFATALGIFMVQAVLLTHHLGRFVLARR